MLEGYIYSQVFKKDEAKTELSKVELRRVDVQAEDAIGEAMAIGGQALKQVKSAGADISKAIKAAEKTIKITEKYVPMAEGLGDNKMVSKLRRSEKDAKDLIKQLNKIQNTIKSF